MRNFREIMYNSTKFHVEDYINEENTKFSRNKCQEIEGRRNFVKSVAACVLAFHEEILETGPKISSNQNLDISQSKYELI